MLSKGEAKPARSNHTNKGKMQITLKTVSGANFTVEAEATDTVRAPAERLPARALGPRRKREVKWRVVRRIFLKTWGVEPLRRGR